MRYDVGVPHEAHNAAAMATIGALRSAIAIYYAKTAIPPYACLCQAIGDGGCNLYRHVSYSAPCFPANIAEVESLLDGPFTWPTDGGGQCYSAANGTVVGCP